MYIFCKAMELQTTFIYIFKAALISNRLTSLYFQVCPMFLPFLVPVVNNTGGELDICLLKKGLVAFFSPAFAGKR